MFDAIATVLAWCYDLVGSYAGAIVLLTLGVMVLLTPLTLKGTRSMIKMQEMQPELKKLQEKYKDDREKLNEEMMAFYKDNGINPVAGCLPTLIQIPVFIVLYQVIRGLTSRVGGLGSATGAAMVGQEFPDKANFDPRYINHDTALYQDLSSTNEMNSWGLDLSITPSQALSEGGVVTALPYLALIVVVAISSWYQQKQIQGRRKPGQAEVNPQQQAIMKVLPFMLPVIAFSMPAALVIYFVFSNLYRVAQQYWITRTLYSDHGELHDVAIAHAAGAKGGKAKSGGAKGNGGAKAGGAKGNGGAKSEKGKKSDGSGGGRSSVKGGTSPKNRAPSRSKNGKNGTSGSSRGRKKPPPAAAAPTPRPRKKKRKRN
jgi:YidC/Oxa1 family membrane protein insertase